MPKSLIFPLETKGCAGGETLHSDRPLCTAFNLHSGHPSPPEIFATVNLGFFLALRLTPSFVFVRPHSPPLLGVIDFYDSRTEFHQPPNTSTVAYRKCSKKNRMQLRQSDTTKRLTIRLYLMSLIF